MHFRLDCCIAPVLILLVGCNEQQPRPRPAPPPEPRRTLRLVTYNVLADRRHADARFPALIREIKTADPDVVALQECTPEFLKALQADAAFKDFDIAGPPDTPVPYRGLCLLARLPLRQVTAKPLTSKQSRGVLLADLAVNGRIMRLAVVHLDSFLELHAERTQQLKEVLALLAGADDQVLLGDFNFGDGEQPESKVLPNRFRDAWVSLHPGKPGYTWDMEKSSMARAGAFPGESSRRLDRVLVASPKWQPGAARIIGDREIAKGLFPSDHFGLVVELSRQK